MEHGFDTAMLLLGKGGGDGASWKKVNLLYHMAEGVLYETDTRTVEAYALTLPSGTLAAEITALSGRTVFRNQLVPDGNFETVGDWEVDGGTLTVSGHTGECRKTGSTVPTLKQSITLEKTHRHFAHAEVFTLSGYDFDTGLSLSAGDRTANVVGSVWSYNNWKTLEGVVDSLDPDEETGIQFYGTGTITRPGHYRVRNVMVFDLTALFGADYDESDLTQIKEDLAGIGLSVTGYVPESATHPVHAAVMRVESRDAGGKLLGAVRIPASVRRLEGYGESEVGGSGNTLDLAAGTFTEIGHFVDGVWTELDEPLVTDVSEMLPDPIVPAAGGGTLTFVQTSGETLPASAEVDCFLPLSGADG